MDKTERINPDTTKIADEDITASNQPTIISDNGQSRTVSLGSDSGSTKTTALLFDKKDTREKLPEELIEVPEVGAEDLEKSYMSKLISTPFIHRTNEEKLRINRNFLRDAEPFAVERLIEDIKNAPEELQTGFSSLDKWITIPQHKLTLVAGRPEHGKTVFMLNMLLNMSHKYLNKHFLYYSYGEPRADIEIKLINMSGEKPFSNAPEGNITTNFKRWKYELTTRGLDFLKDKAEKDPEYKGLKNYLEVSARIHVMDTNYNIIDLIDSIQAFNNTLPIGGIYIDYLQAVRFYDAPPEQAHQHRMPAICDRLVHLSYEVQFPIIVGVEFAAEEKNTPEYDVLSVDYLKDIGDPKQAANLIIGLQNYSKSRFIGSNINDSFKSRFYNYTFKKAEKMPETFKDKHPNTVILTRVLSNRSGPEPEVEMLFNKWLMKISDLEAKHLPREGRI